ncbi:translation initiation factor eIF-2B subunit beta [Lophium mytilinum]|uniref:Translation initiation factor eIF2B subunit beta n=1 Tax=Lophium mytilinum TaxID=390894 RepID=A0A6A6QWP5_9PEZI|nr:translation initiation factor eIF-2B subunit beta [Lophium mytilinum]
MSHSMTAQAPGLSSYLKSLRSTPVEASIEHFIALLKRRQIRNSRPCALATTQLLIQVVKEFKGKDADKLLRRIRDVGRRLIAAQPREMVVGNIVRRVLGLIREIKDDNADGDSNAVNSDTGSPLPHHDSFNRPQLASSISTFMRHGALPPMESASGPESLADSGELPHRPALFSSHTSYAPLGTSLFGLFSQPDTPSNTSTPTGRHSPIGKHTMTASALERIGESTILKRTNIKAEVLEGMNELQDELEQSDDQIAANALDHIHSNEIILTHTASTSVQKFLLAAAKKRKFTVVHAEAHPNDHDAVHATILTGKKRDAEVISEEAGERWKPLTAAGITVVLIPDSHVFAIMARVNKVILATHSVLANGGLVAAAGARVIASAAKVHRTPVVVVTGVYKLSPVYPFDIDELIEYGDAGNVVPYDDGDFVDKVDVDNPLYDYVPPDLVDLYVTNLGGHAPSYLYRIVADHYHPDDINLSGAVEREGK